MSPHLDAKQIALYREHNLGVPELLAVDDHLSECEQCRAQLANRAGFTAWSNLIDSTGDHLTYEQIAAFVDGALAAEQYDEIQSHIQQCARCAADCGDLRTFSRELRQPRPRRRMLYAAIGAIAAAVIVSVAVLFTLNRRPEIPVVAKLAVEVREGNAVYGLDSHGQLVAPGGLAPSERDLLRSALNGASVALNVPQALEGRRNVVLRGPVSSENFGLIAPVAERVLGQQPEFRWDAVKGASAYKVEVFTSDYDPVMSSPRLAAPNWTPSKLLDRGKTYSWQVTAYRESGDLTSPQPPAPEARFEIAGPEQAQRIEQAREKSDHLLAALLEINGGLRDDAVADLGLLEKENPGSQVVRRLREAVASR